MKAVEDVPDRLWDVVVVGTGVGGATLGYALARAGLQVLFCERGKSPLGHAHALRGEYAEHYLNAGGSSAPEARDIMARAGRWQDEVEDRSGRTPHRMVPLIGSGAGGSSALYGMAMERFFPSDFSPRSYFADQPETSLPETWPIGYGDLLPHYEAAERLFRVRGTPDPLREEPVPSLLKPPPLTAGGKDLFDQFSRQGLSPYRVPLACEQLPGCQCCQGYLCPRACKNDSLRVCLEPAIRQHGALLLDECEVQRLEVDRRAVTNVVCSRRGAALALRAKTVVLAAGALASPAVLLRSVSPRWPQGLANGTGLVGRNLMRHFVDLFLLQPRSRDFDNRQKELAFNNFYHFRGGKLGTVQSFGRLPPPATLVRSLQQEARLPGLPAALRLAAPLVEAVTKPLVERSMVLASIAEDPPYLDNRVTLGSGGALAVSYRVRRRDRQRIKLLRRQVGRALAGYRVKTIPQALNNHRLAHACGTCRFGEDPRTSVLDAHNRAHELDNLYVVDASFMPSSGGTNPALTIAANALRVAQQLLA